VVKTMGAEEGAVPITIPSAVQSSQGLGLQEPAENA